MLIVLVILTMLRALMMLSLVKILVMLTMLTMLMILSSVKISSSGNICGPFAAESIGAYRIRNLVGSLMIFAPIALIEKIWIHLHGDLLIVCVPIYKR